jgi:hypothetical protein
VYAWPGREVAKQLRLWPTLDKVIEQACASDVFGAGFLLGSLARGEGDDYSDIDLMLLVRDGCWDDAWSHRLAFSGDALYRWDETEPSIEKAKHAWLTRDFVLVECTFTTATGAHPLADPFVVVKGDESDATRLPRLPPFTRERLQEIVDDLAAKGKANEVQSRYGDLVAALRRTRAPSVGAVCTSHVTHRVPARVAADSRSPDERGTPLHHIERSLIGEG